MDNNNGWYKLSEQSPDTVGNYNVITNDDKVMTCYVNQVGWWTMWGGQFSGDMGKCVIDSKLVDREVIWWKPIGPFPEQYSNQ